MSEFGKPNCAWLNRLKNSARKSTCMPSRYGSLKCLISEKSVLTKSGPDTGVREAFPSSPTGAAAKQEVLNHWLRVGWLDSAEQVWLGRFTVLAFCWKLTPDWLLLLITKTGNPERIFWITSTSQFPRIESNAPFQLLPKRLPLPI